VKLELDDDDGVKAWRFTKKKDVVGEELDWFKEVWTLSHAACKFSKDFIFIKKVFHLLQKWLQKETEKKWNDLPTCFNMLQINRLCCKNWPSHALMLFNEVWPNWHKTPINQTPSITITTPINQTPINQNIFFSYLHF
jgi:hypothetical protein